MAKKAAPKAAEPKAAAATGEKKSKQRSKAEIYTKLAETSGLSKKRVVSVQSRSIGPRAGRQKI